VRVVTGLPDPETADHRQLRPSEIAEGWRLSCQARIYDDMTCEVPQLLRVPKAATMGLGRLVILDPNVRKIYLELPEPTLEDQRSDVVRLKDALTTEGLDMVPDLRVLRRLPHAVREAAFGVPAVPPERPLVAVEPGEPPAGCLGAASERGTMMVGAPYSSATSPCGSWNSSLPKSPSPPNGPVRHSPTARPRAAKRWPPAPGTSRGAPRAPNWPGFRVHPEPRPLTAPQQDAAFALTQRVGDACAKKYGSALGTFNTADTARDMDRLRQSLGDAQLSYLGYSYGTELGTAYADAFPQNVRAMVLDGAVDPSLDPVEEQIRQMASFQLAFNDYVADCVQVRGCPLGDDPAKAVDRYHALVDPLVSAPGHTSDPRGLSYQDAITGGNPVSLRDQFIAVV